MPRHSRSYKADLYKSLQDDSEMIAYLQAACEDSIFAFLLALRNIAEARQISKIAELSELNRVSLYRMLAEDGNPKLSSIVSILKTLDLRISVEQQVKISQPAEQLQTVAARRQTVPWQPIATRALDNYSFPFWRKECSAFEEDVDGLAEAFEPLPVSA